MTSSRAGALPVTHHQGCHFLWQILPNSAMQQETKNLELDTNVAKNGQFHRFFHRKQQIPWQMVNSAVQRENLCAREYCWPCS